MIRNNINIKDFTIEYIEQVALLEQRCFPDPWTYSTFEIELNNEKAHYSVMLDGDNVIGYAGFWKVLDEGHIMSIAVAPEHRGRNLSDVLMKNMIERAKALSIGSMTLEVRESNIIAQRLYEKYGFVKEGIRKRYYENDGENAIIMWADIN